MPAALVSDRHAEESACFTAEVAEFAAPRGSMAEDKRFELLRGCPQHAFQACALGH
jgi:hypothetical protein